MNYQVGSAYFCINIGKIPTQRFIYASIDHAWIHFKFINIPAVRGFFIGPASSRSTSLFAWITSAEIGNFILLYFDLWRIVISLVKSLNYPTELSISLPTNFLFTESINTKFQKIFLSIYISYISFLMGSKTFKRIFNKKLFPNIHKFCQY